jgi:hypothetical protein
MVLHGATGASVLVFDLSVAENMDIVCPCTGKRHGFNQNSYIHATELVRGNDV